MASDGAEAAVNVAEPASAPVEEAQPAEPAADVILAEPVAVVEAAPILEPLPIAQVVAGDEADAAAREPKPLATAIKAQPPAPAVVDAACIAESPAATPAVSGATTAEEAPQPARAEATAEAAAAHGEAEQGGAEQGDAEHGGAEQGGAAEQGARAEDQGAATETSVVHRWDANALREQEQAARVEASEPERSQSPGTRRWNALRSLTESVADAKAAANAKAAASAAEEVLKKQNAAQAPPAAVVEEEAARAAEGQAMSIVSQGIATAVEYGTNLAERATGLDLDGDGDVGLTGQPKAPPAAAAGPATAGVLAAAAAAVDAAAASQIRAADSDPSTPLSTSPMAGRSPDSPVPPLPRSKVRQGMSPVRGKGKKKERKNSVDRKREEGEEVARKIQMDKELRSQAMSECEAAEEGQKQAVARVKTAVNAYDASRHAASKARLTADAVKVEAGKALAVSEEALRIVNSLGGKAAAAELKKEAQAAAIAAR